MSFPASLTVAASRSQVERQRIREHRAERARVLADAKQQLDDCRRNRQRSEERRDELESRALTNAVALASRRTTFVLDELGKIETALLVEKRILSAYDIAEAEIQERIAKLQAAVDEDRAEQANEDAEQRRSDLRSFVHWDAADRKRHLQMLSPAERQRFIDDLSPADRQRWQAGATVDELKTCGLPAPWERSA